MSPLLNGYVNLKNYLNSNMYMIQGLLIILLLGYSFFISASSLINFFVNKRHLFPGPHLSLMRDFSVREL
jgi:hypothetical protein